MVYTSYIRNARKFKNYPSTLFENPKSSYRKLRTDRYGLFQAHTFYKKRDFLIVNRARMEIHCDEAALKGITGKGVGVAVLDTGIYLHEDLKGKIQGFKDFVHGKKLPYDDNGHGTHIAAMIAGSGAASGIFKGDCPGKPDPWDQSADPERKWICGRCFNGT